MRLWLVATMVAAMTMAAFAQGANGIGGAQGAGRAAQPKGETPEETARKKSEEKANEKAFSEAVKRIPVPQKKYDPWGDVRNAGNAR
jgi:hypothetical protein